jgi:uncharacterized protein YjbI with pentapeptide repeats
MEPDSSSTQRPVIQAREILAKIERGEDVEYDGVIVEGDLDITGLKLRTVHVERTEGEKQLGLTDERKVISSQITIADSEIQGKANFTNAHFEKPVSFGGAKFTGGDADFRRAEFARGIADFRRAEFARGIADFRRAEFGGDADFGGAKFTGGCAYFGRAEFGEYAYFEGAEFGGYVSFGGAKFTGEYAYFGRAEFSGYADFGGAEFGGDAIFRGAEFGGDADFGGAKFTSEDVSFEDTKFADPASQEAACRIAKRMMEEKGNKQKADYYFFRETEAIRIQNGIKGIGREKYPAPANIRGRLSQLRDKIYLLPSKIKRFLIYDVLEYVFIQRVFGYGVRPFNVAKAWLIVVFTLGVVYWAGAGVVRGDEPLEWYEYFYFSIVTAATPGYAGYTPATGFYTLIAGAQAIFGTFMWAAFIATFARKWQR